MPLTGDMAKLRSLHRKILAIGQVNSAAQKAVLTQAANAIKALTRQQLAEGIAPDGSMQPPKKNGKPGMKSAKLARGAIAVEPRGDGIYSYMKNPHKRWPDIMWAHQDGHTFPRRKSGGGAMRFNRRGKLVSTKSFARTVKGHAAQLDRDNTRDLYAYTKTGKMRLLGKSVRAKSHVVGQRVLPARPVFPSGGSLPKRWTDGAARGLVLGLRMELDKVAK